jgi:hypothetical protein
MGQIEWVVGKRDRGRNRLRLPLSHEVPYVIVGRVLAQAVSRGLLTAEALVRSQGRSCGICGGQNGNRTGFYSSPSSFP